MSECILKENERIDDLDVNGFRIIQNPFCFCFGMDAVLLANFVKVSSKAKCIDIGTGTGVIPLISTAKNRGSHWTGLEVQSNMVDMASRSVELNDAGDRISIVEGDVRNVREIFKPCSFKVVTSNPPYMKQPAGLQSSSDTINISRAEIMANLEDVVSAASYLLPTRGTFAMVHRPSRLPEIMEVLLKYRLEPKRLQLVQPTRDKEANLVLIECVKEAGKELRLLPTLIVYKENGEYTEELLSYYR
ncbi:MAG: tRNA1(Val) (adenine(37)-N6)-methyltransferase [Eubacterium sp.]|nr:tRNA1(Val) (adenine(37)-N6)-methyltransferase [Eubacterium sp.]